MADNIQEIMKKDMEKIAATKVERSQFTPIMNQKASDIPAVKDVATKNYSEKTGFINPHPLQLMTAMAEECPWVDLGVRVIGAACSSCAPMFRVASANKKRKSTCEDLTDILSYPNPHQTGFDLFKTTFEDLALYGNAYWQIIHKKAGGIHSIYTLPPETIRVVPYFDENEIMHFVYIQLDNVQSYKVFTEDEIVHFKTTNNRSFAYGKPLFLSQLTNIASNISAAKAIAQWFEQGFVGGAIFKGDSDPEVAQRNREFIKEYFSKPENFGRTMILEGEMELVKDGNKFVDFDFSKLSATERDNILSAAGIPISQAGVRSDSGQANAEIVAAEEAAFHRNTVSMYQKYVFERINSKLFRQILGIRDISIEPGVATRFSNKDAIETAKALAEVGIQINEYRDIVGAGRVPSDDAGKTFVISTNNGAVKAADILGVDLETGEQVETIFEKAQNTENGTTNKNATNKAKEYSGGHGLGGDLKKIANKE